MCGLTIGIMAVCGMMIMAAFSLQIDESVRFFVVLAALLLAVVLPPVMTFFIPLFRTWNAANRHLRDRLIADGVMTLQDLDAGARPVELWQVMHATERMVPKTRERGYLLFQNGMVRFFGEHSCFKSSRFKALPGRSPRCSRCAIIWVCGMAPFRLILEDQERPVEFLVSAREGRTLSRAQRNTDMLAELGMLEDSYEPSEHDLPADCGTTPRKAHPSKAPDEAAKP